MIQSNVIYNIVYINTDDPENCEILGSYMDENEAVSELLERANYREKNGVLTQYFKETNEYPSYEFLFNMVKRKKVLYDVDIYKIVKSVLK